MRKTSTPLRFRTGLMLVLFLLPFAAQAATGEVLEAELVAAQDAVLPGGDLEVAFSITMAEHWHVYAPAGEESFTLPIDPALDGYEGLTWQFPEADLVAVAGTDDPAPVYGGTFHLLTTISVPATVTDTFALNGSVFYQACDDQQCLIPDTRTAVLKLPIVASTAEINLVNSRVFASTAATSEAISVDEDNEIEGWVNERGMFLTFILIFLGGLALNLTPCVYPLIPITISFFGGANVSRTRTFWMALAYVLGIAVTYSVLGVVAALGGGLFGALLTNPAVLIGIALVLVALSLSMFGLYEFRLPSGLMTAAGQSKTGIFGSFFMGLTLGIIAAPCVGPFVVGLLTYVATLQNVVLGFFMFFTLAMGLGLPYLVLAMFSSRISSLPRSGAWMVGVRVIFGLVLVAMALYFVSPLMGEWGTLVMGIFLLGSGIYLIMFDRNGAEAKAFVMIKQVLAIGAIIAATWMIMPNETAGGEQIDWVKPTTQSELNAALDAGKPVMIDIYADWCIPCKEMDAVTFPDPEVVALSREFTMIKIDLTHMDGEFESQVQKQYGIKGVPAYIFLDPTGMELPNLRSSGFEKPGPFLQRMRAAL